MYRLKELSFLRKYFYILKYNVYIDIYLISKNTIIINSIKKIIMKSKIQFLFFFS